jgi:3'(2'), 5'-bisphosphate nucleotidase
VQRADDHALAARIAEDAGRVLVGLRGSPGDTPFTGTELGRQGDRRSHELIVAALAAARPGDAVRSEEAVAARAPSAGAGPGAGGRPDGAARVWVVDPLDGTREYAEGRADFAVHVALVVGADPVVGAVALPAEGLVFATADPAGDPATIGPAGDPATIGPAGDPATIPAGDHPFAVAALAPRADGALRVAVSRTRPPVEAQRLASRLGAELVPMGSAGVKVMAVVRGHVDAYVHGGGQYEWDSAAPVAVARAHGAHASRLDGSPLRYGRPDPWLPDLLVCRPELLDTIIDALGR